MKKPGLVWFSIVLTEITVLLIPQLVAAETWYVKKTSAKLQAEASARSKVLGKLNKGTSFEIKKKSVNFSRFPPPEKQGGFSGSNLPKKLLLGDRKMAMH